MNTALVGLVCSIITLIVKAIVDLCIARWNAAQKEREEREDLEAELRASAFLWKEHAYSVRVAAIKAGVSANELPEVPKEN